MTPQAMRKQINHLENEVGVPILLRTPQGVAPSDAGRVLYDYARRLIALSDEALSACRQKAGAEQQRVRIGLYRNANLHLMPRLVTRFAEEHPDIELSFTDFVIYEEIEKALADGAIDVVMTFGNEQRRKEGVVNLVFRARGPHLLGSPRFRARVTNRPDTGRSSRTRHRLPHPGQLPVARYRAALRGEQRTRDHHRRIAF